MAQTRAIGKRIKSIKNIAKITKAMEMVAASKMKRAQERGLSGRPYTEKIEQVIADMSAIEGTNFHPLLEHREVKNIALIHITPDRGLCGGLNGNINRMTGKYLLEEKKPVMIIAVGRKGRDFMRQHTSNIIAEFLQLSDQPSLIDTLPISRIIIDEYKASNIDEVYVVYPRFVSTIVQNPVMKKLLPVEPAEIKSSENVDYLYEPNAQEVLDQLLPRYVEIQIYHAVLETIASEHSARMVAMKNATDSANELVGSLTLLFNKARQETITNELLEISGGAAALTD
ncbi:ATP synthase F1 subunit gamma [Chloroflexota bacterium]